MRLLSLVLLVSLALSALTGCSAKTFIATSNDGGASSGAGNSGSAGSGSSSSGATSSGSASGASSGSSGSCATGSVATGSVSFEMRVSPTLNATYCYGSSCSHEFVTIRGANGLDLTIDQPCVADCNVCQTVACSAICPAPTPLTTTGVKHVWDGTQWSSATCGANLTCTRSACTPAGHYVATMCADLNTGGPGPACAASQMPTCRDFAFDWPPPNGGASVIWTIGDADAGAPPGDAGRSPAMCASTADCPPTEICGFPSMPACMSKGQCFPAPGLLCAAYSPGCACDGTQLNVACNGLPPGYETKPLRHTGACVDGG